MPTREYNDDDADNMDNLPPGTKFKYVDEPDTSTPGIKNPTIKVTYPNGHVVEVSVEFTVTGNVVEQTDPHTKPSVPATYVKVTIDPTEFATNTTIRTFWVNPEVEVTIEVNDPVGKEPNIFVDWDHSLTGRFTAETTIRVVLITPDDPDAEISVEGLPVGLQFDDETRTITGTPVIDDWDKDETERTFNISVLVENSDGSTITETVTITVEKKIE